MKSNEYKQKIYELCQERDRIMGGYTTEAQELKKEQNRLIEQRCDIDKKIMLVKDQLHGIKERRTKAEAKYYEKVRELKREFFDSDFSYVRGIPVSVLVSELNERGFTGMLSRESDPMEMLQGLNELLNAKNDNENDTKK